MSQSYSGIRAIFFDFDDTLGNREQYAYECYRSFVTENCDVTDPVELEAIVQDCMLWDEKGNINKNHVKEQLEKKYGIVLPYENFNIAWDERLWKYCVPYEDSAATLEALQKNYFLGIITNGPSDGQRNKLRQSGLADYFDPEAVIVSGDYGCKKPDVRLFEKAAAHFGLQTEECIYVGDIFANDVLGAYRSGMKPVWIWHEGERRCMAEIPTIHAISELIELLKN